MAWNTFSLISRLSSIQFLLLLAISWIILKKGSKLQFGLFFSSNCSSGLVDYFFLCLFFLSLGVSCINLRLSSILFLGATSVFFFSCFFLPINYNNINNYYIQTMSCINVYVRMRPHLPHQRDQKSEKKKIVLEEDTQQVRVQLTQHREKNFKFNRVFGQQTSQQQIFNGICTPNLVQRVVEGYHSTIFAYGQTGSGKTFTIEGGDSLDLQGIIPQAIKILFTKIQQKSAGEKGYKVFISFIQIYNECIFDLIDSNEGKPLKMRWNKHQQFTVQNMFEGQCRSSEEALKWWKKGQKNKVMGSHKMNNTSSRSHCLLTLRVQSFLLQDPSQQIESKLQIVDLAGSQRQKVTKSTGVVFRQGIEINKSLFTLRQVIASLYQTSTTGKANIIPPYRDSKLTSLLKQSIGGNSYCVMIACLNPTMAHFQESVQTLTYASMASFISNAPTKNVDPKIQQNYQLKQQNVQLKEQLNKLQEHIQYLTKLLQANECASCKDKNSFKKTETHLSLKYQNPIQQETPTGLVNFSRGSNRTKKYMQQKSLNYNSIREINQLPDTSYQHLPQKATAGKALKSTKEIIQSITMIKDLISANSTLRQKIEVFKAQIQKQQKETFALMKENQVLRDRWEMISVNIKPQSDIVGEQAPIAMLQRMMKEQRGEGLRVNSYNSNNSQSVKMDTEGYSTSKMSYNDFLRGKRVRVEKQRKEGARRKNRIYSQSKRIGQQSFLI